MTQSSWIIDSRSPYDGQSGLHGKPVSLGAVVAEIPTAFGSIVIRDPGTIGKPCPSKEELDRLGLAHATAIAALPELISALEDLLNRTAHLEDAGPYGDGFQSDELEAAISAARAALTKAKPA